MTDNKLVSVGVPVYNEERHIEECLESIAADSYPDKEIIISDNASTDRTWQIVENFKEKYDDVYDIRIIRHESNNGALHNFNHVLDKSRGEFFAWIGAHDTWDPEFVKECLAILESDRDTCLVMPLVKWVDEQSTVLDEPHAVIDTRSARSPPERISLLIDHWKQCTAIYGLHRKSSVLATMPWPRTFASDKLALFRIAKQGHIASTGASCYFRRARAAETRDDRIQRQLRAMDVKGVARKLPRIVYKGRLLYEAAFVKGPLWDRARLIGKAIWQLLTTTAAEAILGLGNMAGRAKLRPGAGRDPG